MSEAEDYSCLHAYTIKLGLNRYEPSLHVNGSTLCSYTHADSKQATRFKPIAIYSSNQMIVVANRDSIVQWRY